MWMVGRKGRRVGRLEVLGEKMERENGLRRGWNEKVGWWRRRRMGRSERLKVKLQHA